MQISHFCQILLHFSVFCIGLVLVLADKRCLQSNSDGTDMLLLYSVYAYFCSVDLPTLLIAYGGGYLTFPDPRPSVCLVNNYTQVLFVSFVKMPLLACRIHHTLSAGESCPLGVALGSSQTAAAGFLYIFGLAEFTEEKNEYHKKEELHRPG